MDFGNNLNWVLRLRTSYLAQTALGSSRGFLPIPIKIIEVEKYTLVVGVASTKARPTWRVGAFIAPRQVFTIANSDYGNLVRAEPAQMVFLNHLTLLQFKDFGLNPYALEISVPYYISQLSIEVWEYQGLANAQPLPEQIAEIRSDLSRIESKIDGQTTP